jgi:uncharacterized membrane protein YdbT with pleckstrin-like domain
MSDMDEQLISGESIVTRTTKHWFAPLADSKWAILAILLALVLAWLQGDQTDRIMGFVNRVLSLGQLVLVLGAVGSIAYNIIAWRTAEYAVTNMRVIGHDGLLRRRSYDTLLTSIADVKSVVPAIGRALGYGNLRIMSAAGAAGADTLTTIRGVDAFKKTIVEQKTGSATIAGQQAAVQALADAQTAQTAAVLAATPVVAPAAPSSAEVTATLGELARLRDAGAITPAEFDAKKADLLSRI